MSRTVINDSSDTELFTATNPGQVTGANAQTDALTDTELRATPVPVSGTVTATGVQTDALTDAELRDSPVPVSGDIDATLQVGGADISPTNPLPVDQNPPTAIYAGQTTVAASGTEVPLTTTQALQSGVTVKALSTNTNNVAVGPNPVTMTTGILLAAGEWVFVEVADLATVYVDATTNGEGVSWLGS